MQWLSLYAWLSVGVFAAGALSAWLRWLYVVLVRGYRSSWRDYLQDAPQPRDRMATMCAVFLAPARRFHRRANPLWTFGCWCYHAAILTVVGVYAVCAVLAAVRSREGLPYPLLADGSPLPGGLGGAMMLIFGSGEPGIARYLFGSWAPIFAGIGWWELVAAMAGNLALSIGWATRGMGAVVRDLDGMFRSVPLPGAKSPEHIVVHLLIFGIIQTEWLGRLELVPWAVPLHTWFGLTLLVIAPYTYLAHVFWSPSALRHAWRRHRLRVTA